MLKLFYHEKNSFNKVLLFNFLMFYYFFQYIFVFFNHLLMKINSFLNTTLQKFLLKENSDDRRILQSTKKKSYFSMALHRILLGQYTIIHSEIKFKMHFETLVTSNTQRNFKTKVCRFIIPKWISFASK